MKSFVIKVAKWTLPGTLLCYSVWIGLLICNPSRDTLGLNRLKPFKCNSMVFGTSRSAQGVKPEVLEKIAPHFGKWLNFSFNLGDSPWNDAYTDAIIEKAECSIDPSEAGYFLIFVDPWVLDETCGNGKDSWLQEDWVSVCNVNLFQFAWHNTSPLGVLGIGAGNDLLSVCVSSVPRQILAFFSGQKQSIMAHGVGRDGWLSNSTQLSTSEKQRGIEGLVKTYREEKTRGTVWPGKDNYGALARLIRHLKFGYPNSQISLVRPPVHQEMIALENEWFPEANDWFEQFASRHELDFIDFNDFSNNKTTLDFNDAHHLSSKGAHQFSAIIAETCLSSPKQ